MQCIEGSSEEDSNTMGLTTDQAPERNLWSSLFATDPADFRHFGDFGDFDENPLRLAQTYPDIGFLVRKVHKLVQSGEPEIAKNSQKSQADLT